MNSSIVAMSKLPQRKLILAALALGIAFALPANAQVANGMNSGWYTGGSDVIEFGSNNPSKVIYQDAAFLRNLNAAGTGYETGNNTTAWDWHNSSVRGHWTLGLQRMRTRDSQYHIPGNFKVGTHFAVPSKVKVVSNSWASDMAVGYIHNQKGSPTPCSKNTTGCPVASLSVGTSTCVSVEGGIGLTASGGTSFSATSAIELNLGPSVQGNADFKAGWQRCKVRSTISSCIQPARPFNRHMLMTPTHETRYRFGWATLTADSVWNLPANGNGTFWSQCRALGGSPSENSFTGQERCGDTYNKVTWQDDGHYPTPTAPETAGCRLTLDRARL